MAASEAQSPVVSVRDSTEADAELILSLIRELASFEGAAPSDVSLSVATILRDGFGPSRRFEVLLAEHREDGVCGLVVLLPSYSSWGGAPTLVVHDLYVRAGTRRCGAGRALIRAAAERALRQKCCRMDVNVLGWNRAAREFYESLGFVALADWVPHRINGEAMRALCSAG
eukprot:RCo051196